MADQVRILAHGPGRVLVLGFPAELSQANINICAAQWV